MHSKVRKTDIIFAINKEPNFAYRGRLYFDHVMKTNLAREVPRDKYRRLKIPPASTDLMK